MNKVKNKWLNWRLVWDGFCQVKGIGIAGIIVSVILYILGIAPFVWIVAAMTYWLFRFLNTRSGSDFYHGLSNLKMVYGSYVLAIVAWLLLMQLVLVPVKLMVTSANWWGLVFYNVTYEITVGILTLGVALVAMNLTGNVFGNIIATLLIAFGPRVLLHFFLDNFIETFWVLDLEQQVYRWIDPSQNIFMLELNNYWRWGDFFHSNFYEVGERSFLNSYLFTILYSNLLGIIYILVGGKLFCNRKSEMAGKGGVGSKVQQVLRAAVLLMITVFGSWRLAMYLFRTTPDRNDLYIALVMYVIGVIIYFVTALLMNRSIRLKKDVKWMLGVVALNVLLVIGVTGYGNHLVNDYPKSEEIEGIQVVTSKRNLPYEAWLDDYKIQRAEAESSLVIDDPKVYALISELIETHVSAMKSGSTNPFKYEDRLNAYVKVHYGNKTKTYELWLTDEEHSIVKQAMALVASEQAAEDWEVPLYDDESARKRSTSPIECLITGSGLDTEELTLLQQTLAKELKEKNAPLSAYLGMAYNCNPAVFDVLDYITPDGGNAELPISIDTPETLELLAEMVNEDYDLEFYKDYFDGNASADERDRFYTNEMVFCMIYDQNTQSGREVAVTSWWDMTVNAMSEKEFYKLAKILMKQQTEILAEEHLMYFSFRDVYAFNENEQVMHLGAEEAGQWYNLTEDELEFMRQLFEFEPSGENLQEIESER